MKGTDGLVFHGLINLLKVGSVCSLIKWADKNFIEVFQREEILEQF